MRPSPESSPHNVPHTPWALAAVAAKPPNEDYEGASRRSLTRVPVAANVILVPLDDDYVPNAGCFGAVTRDVSTSGMRLLATRAVQCRFIQVEFSQAGKERIRVVLQVLRCNTLGRFYEIAGQFIARIEGT